MTLFLQQPSIEPQRPEEGAAEQWSPRRPDIFRRRSGSGGRRHPEVNSYRGETGHGEGVSRRLDSPQQLASTPREMLQIRTWSVFLLLINTRSLRFFFLQKMLILLSFYRFSIGPGGGWKPGVKVRVRQQTRRQRQVTGGVAAASQHR